MEEGCVASDLWYAIIFNNHIISAYPLILSVSREFLFGLSWYLEVYITFRSSFCQHIACCYTLRHRYTNGGAIRWAGNADTCHILFCTLSYLFGGLDPDLRVSVYKVLLVLVLVKFLLRRSSLSLACRFHPVVLNPPLSTNSYKKILFLSCIIIFFHSSVFSPRTTYRLHNIVFS